MHYKEASLKIMIYVGMFSSPSLQERQQNLYKRRIHKNSQFRQQE